MELFLKRFTIPARYTKAWTISWVPRRRATRALPKEFKKFPEENGDTHKPSIDLWLNMV